MEKGKQLFSYLGSVFTFCMLLALTVLLPGTKADAQLSLEAINYDNSTITIATNSGDTALYFSDKNKKKWETAMDSFVDGKCTMDISWVSVTKDYMITFKGDKTTEDVLSVTIPKQISNFKAKYDKKGSKVTFTNKPSGRTVQYRKNNTSKWTDIANEATFGENLQRLYENGAKVYFRLAAEKGENGNVGKRYSKEVLCSITKKSDAPKITVNDDATITVQSGWQVRRVKVQESGGTEYVIGYDKIDSVKDVGDTDYVKDPNYDEAKKWYTYRSEKKVPITDLADNSEGAVYLQFRKAASSSAQVSHIATVKIPKQEAAPDPKDISIEYTSFTTFNIKIAKATTKDPYEYCIIGESDVKNVDGDPRIIDLDDAKWKMISSNVVTGVKKTEAPVNSYIFLRKKAYGKIGDDDFRLATDYVCAIPKLTYPTAEEEKLEIQYPEKPNGDWNGSIDIIDGVCTKDNQDGYIKFNITTRWNAKIKDIRLAKDPNPTDSATNVAVVTKTSSVSKVSDKLYNITATITGIELTAQDANDFKNSNENSMTLYAYIEYDTPGEEKTGLSSGWIGEEENKQAKGLVINLKKKSSIEIDEHATETINTKNVKRIIGATTASDGQKQNEEIKFKVNLNKTTVTSVKLGNYTLDKDKNYYNLTGNIFTVKLAELEKDEALAPYYGEEQKLVIGLENGEKLNDIGITLIEPVSLSKLYSWAYRTEGIPNTKQEVVTHLPSGGSTTETKYLNNYSVEYKIPTTAVNTIYIKSVTAKSATLGSIGIFGGFNNETKKIEFSNDSLKNPDLVGLTSKPVKIAFDITLSNNVKYEYVIKQGCMFTVLS